MGLFDDLIPGSNPQITRGSTFGEQAGPGTDSGDTGGFAGGGRSTNNPEDYAALPVNTPVPYGYKFPVTNPNTGKTVWATRRDVGPAQWTGRGVDLAPSAMQKLGANTDDPLVVDTGRAFNPNKLFDDLIPKGKPTPPPVLDPLGVKQAGADAMAQAAEVGPQGRQIVHNADGSVSTERTTTAQIDGKFYNIPTLYGGKQVSPDEAVSRFKAAGMTDPETGKALQGYSNITDALINAEARSMSLGNQIGQQQTAQQPQSLLDRAMAFAKSPSPQWLQPAEERARAFVEGAGVPSSLEQAKDFLLRSPVQDVKDIYGDVTQIPERLRNIGQTLETSPGATVVRAPLSPEAFGVYGTAAGLLVPGLKEKFGRGPTEGIREQLSPSREGTAPDTSSTTAVPVQDQPTQTVPGTPVSSPDQLPVQESPQVQGTPEYARVNPDVVPEPTLEQAVKSGGTNIPRSVELIDGSQHQVAPFQPITPDGDIALSDGNIVSKDAVAKVLDEKGGELYATQERQEPVQGQTLTPEQQSQLAQAQLRKEMGLSNADNWEARGNPEQAAKQRKGVGFQYAAEVRRITGNLTAKEAAAKTAREASNYIGKPVMAGGQEGTVVSNPFGKVRVKLKDGTVKSFDPKDVSAIPKPEPPKPVATEPTAVQSEQPAARPAPTETTSRFANRFVEERQKAGEIGEIAPGQGYATGDLVNRGLTMSPEEINQHVSDVMQNAGGDPKLQAAAIRAEEARLSQRSQDLSRVAQANPQDINARVAADNAFKDVTDFHNGPVAKLKNDWHAQGMAMQGELPVDLSTVNGLREAWLKDNGKAPPPSMEGTFRRVAKHVQDTRVAEQNGSAKLGEAIERATKGKKLPTAEDVAAKISKRMNGEEVLPCRV